MLDSSALWALAIRVPLPFPGETLHRAALRSATAGAFAAAERLFERAATRYRAELKLEALARLRVHQLMTQVRSRARPDLEEALCREAERRLLNLARIESPDPPFEMIEAHELLARWLSEPAAMRAIAGRDTHPEPARTRSAA